MNSLPKVKNTEKVKQDSSHAGVGIMTFMSTFHKDDGAENQLQALFASLRRTGWPFPSHRNVVERQPKHVVLNEETVAKGFEHKGLIEPMRRVIIHLRSGGGGDGGRGGDGGGVGETATHHRPVQCECWQIKRMKH